MAFFGFTDQFTNSPIQRAYADLLTLNLPDADTTIELEWAFQNPSTPYPFSSGVNVVTNDSDTNVIRFPDATYTSVSQTIIILNQGTETITIQNFLGGDIMTVPGIEAGIAWMFWCTDNSTQSGQWMNFQLGAGTSAVVAASLIDPTDDTNEHSNAGGLKSFGTYLKENNLINYFTTGVSYDQASGDRGSLLVWTAGSGTYNCLPTATSGNGFIFAIHNAIGAGGEIAIVPDGTDEIDNTFNAANPLRLGEGQSGYFISDGNGSIYTIGLTQINATSTQEYRLDISPGGVFTVDAENSIKLIQKFEGAFNAPTYPAVTVQYPPITDEFYFWNDSLNPVIVKIQGGGNTFSIPVGGRFIAFSDGAELYNTPNFILFADGTFSLPSVTFASDQTTGMFKLPDALGFASAGQQVLSMNIGDGVISPVSGTFSNLITSQEEGTNLLPQIRFLAVDGFVYGIGFNSADPANVFITVNGVIVFGATQTSVGTTVPVILPAGSAATPSLAFTGGDSDTGLFINGELQLNVTDGGETAFTFSTFQNVSAAPINVIQNQEAVSYVDSGISIYSLMRAYG